MKLSSLVWPLLDGQTDPFGVSTGPSGLCSTGDTCVNSLQGNHSVPCFRILGCRWGRSSAPVLSTMGNFPSQRWNLPWACREIYSGDRSRRNSCLQGCSRAWRDRRRIRSSSWWQWTNRSLRYRFQVAALTGCFLTGSEPSLPCSLLATCRIHRGEGIEPAGKYHRTPSMSFCGLLVWRRFFEMVVGIEAQGCSRYRRRSLCMKWNWNWFPPVRRIRFPRSRIFPQAV